MPPTLGLAVLITKEVEYIIVRNYYPGLFFVRRKGKVEKTVKLKLASKLLREQKIKHKFS